MNNKQKIVYRLTFRKKGYKPFNKTITEEMPSSMLYGLILPLEKIDAKVKAISDAWINSPDKITDSVRINVTAEYNNQRIPIKAITIDGGLF